MKHVGGIAVKLGEIADAPRPRAMQFRPPTNAAMGCTLLASSLDGRRLRATPRRSGPTSRSTGALAES